MKAVSQLRAVSINGVRHILASRGLPEACQVDASRESIEARDYDASRK
jgi:hypothetical protein